MKWVQSYSNLNILWHYLSLRLEWKLTFSSPGHCWVFQICWHIECSIFTASSFRIWYSSTGITSLPLALFIVMLPKTHLTSHSRMSGSRWVITPSWLMMVNIFLYGKGQFSFQFQRKAMPKNAQTTTQLPSSHMLVKWCLKFSKPGFSNMWTVNFQMFKLVLEKAEEPETKLPTSTGSSKIKRVPEKHLFLLYWLCQSLWLCGSQ